MFGAAQTRVKAELYAALASMANAGLSIGEALTIAGREMGTSPLARAVPRMGHEVSGGRPLAEAMRDRPGLFSPLEVATVEVGEQTGRFERVLRNLADFYERDLKVRHLLTRELAYPIVLFAGILFIPLLADFIRIWLTGTLIAALGALLVRLLVYVLFIGLPAGLAILVVRGMRGSEEGRARLDGVKLNLPLVGGVFRKIALARYCRALASLYSSGVLMGTAMRLAGEAAGNEAVRRDLTAYAGEVEGGGSLSSAFERSSLMPESVRRMLATGELTGDVDAMAEKVAAHLEQEAETSIHQFAVSLTPVAVVIAGIIVAVMVISFYADLYSF